MEKRLEKIGKQLRKCFERVENLEKEKKQETEELKYYSSVIKDSNDAIIIQDLKGKILAWNKGAEKIYEYTQKEMLGKNIIQTIAETDKESAQKQLHNIQQGKPTFRAIQTRKTKTGKIIYVDITYTPIKEKGKITRIATTERDITQRKEEEEKLKKANEQLQEAARLKDELFNITSHELKTPLIPLIAYTDQIRRGVFGGLNEDQQQAFETMDKNILNLSNLIDEFLDISKLQAGKMQFTISKIQPEKLIQEAVKPLRQKANEKGLKIQLDIKKGLPEIHVDTLRIQQALAKIVLNAVQFTKKGSITIKAEKEKNNLIIDIIDTGIGIPKKYHSKIFEKFFQAEPSYTRAHGGIGLGLKINRRIIQAHEGTLELLKSEVGKGSTFRITLPITKKSKENGETVNSIR